MNELSLFTGVGGGILGSMLLGHRIVGAVEFNEYCCKVLEQRQRDGILERFPIFNTDIRDFIRHGYADLYKGHCDLISAGFPCQPFSVAGKRAGADDPRNMWPATIDTVRAVRPRYCFFENVPGLLASGYFERILCDLAESGYDARWRVLSAAEVGAPHLRDRLWIVAHARSAGTRLDSGWTSGSSGQGRQSTNARQSTLLRQEHGPHRAKGLNAGSGNVRHTPSAGLQNGRGAQVGEPRPQPQLKRSSWWQAEPALGRVVDELSDWLDFAPTVTTGEF